MSLRYAYNTNGIQNHRLEEAIALVAEAGYDGVALTLDHHHLDPFAPDLTARATALARELDRRGLGSVIETGARFLLDPRAKHEPTLVSPEPEGRARRIDFLTRAIEVAEILGSEAVSFWAGVPRTGLATADAWSWLVDGVATVVDHASARGVSVACEPEPGMLVETLDDYERLHAEVPGLPLALDVGHLLVTGEREPAVAIAEMRPRLATVALEDMRRGVHVHLPFGEGDLDLPPVLAALVAAEWRGLVCIELSRDSHRAHTMVGEARQALRRAESLVTA